MMQITSKEWLDYVTKLASINKKASTLLNDFIQVHGTEDMYPIIDYAYALVNRYGGASSELACQMYDQLAKLQNANVISAVPAELPDKSQIARAINGTKNQLNGPSDAIGRLVKKSASDTMIQNAKRDGAEYAWINHGDSCVYCKYLSSFGWLHANLNNGNRYLGHIHNNCDCEFAIRFDGKSTVEGYNPEKFREEIENAEGDTIEEKLNSMRRKKYDEIKDNRNARRRALYAKNKSTYKVFDSGEEANKYFKEEEKRWTGLLSDSEKKAIDGYTGTDFTDINLNLRTNIDDDLDVNKLITNIDKAISKSRLNDNITVYRVVDQNGLQGMDVNNCIGKIYNDKAYMSTAASYKGVLDGVDDNFTVFKINVPKGNGNGAYINSLSQYRDAEYEFLLKRDTKCRILKVGEMDGKKMIEMEVIPND